MGVTPGSPLGLGILGTLYGEVCDNFLDLLMTLIHGVKQFSIGFTNFALLLIGIFNVVAIRTISHMRLRANDHCTTSNVIGGKGIVGPSAFYTMVEGPTE